MQIKILLSIIPSLEYMNVILPNPKEGLYEFIEELNISLEQFLEFCFRYLFKRIDIDLPQVSSTQLYPNTITYPDIPQIPICVNIGRSRIQTVITGLGSKVKLFKIYNISNFLSAMLKSLNAKAFMYGNIIEIDVDVPSNMFQKINQALTFVNNLLKICLFGPVGLESSLLFDSKKK